MKNENPICGDGPTLLAFAAGSLSQEDSTAVEAHLGICSDCQRLARENDELARFYISAFREEALHPSPAELTELAEGVLDSTSRATIQDHLTACEECREIVSVLEKVQMEIESPGLLERLQEAASNLNTGWRSFQAGLAPWVRSPVPAYLLALLLLYPAYIGLSGLGMNERVQELEAPTLLPPPTPLQSEGERGQEPQVQVEHQDGRTVVTFFVPVETERYRYHVDLRRQGRTLFSSPDAQSFDGIGTFVLFLPEGSLEPGNYELLVNEIERESGNTASVTTFVFSSRVE